MKMNLFSAQRSLIATLSISFTHFAIAQNRGVVDLPTIQAADETADVSYKSPSETKVLESV